MRLLFRNAGARRLGPALAALAAATTVLANPIPLELPRYDGSAPDHTKPVKVYILAGQSNMVGFGHLQDSRPLYPSVFLSADPAIIPGTMPVGGSALAAHGIFQSAGADAPSGATVLLYEGAYDPAKDYGSLEAVRSAAVALGTVAEMLPALDGPHTAVATAFIEVPVSGEYTMHAGFGDSSHAVVVLDGREVYRKDPGGRAVVETTTLEAGRRYPVTITYFKSGSAAFWMEQVNLKGTGDLMSFLNAGKYTHLAEPDGSWVARGDVVLKEARLRPDSPAVPLSATANGNMFGPELGFGFVMGTFHDEPVLLIKTAQGNRSLAFDFRPPSSGRLAPDNDYEGYEYRAMVKGVRDVLQNLGTHMPGYQGQGYEIAGFAWWQGHKDAGIETSEYEKHLINLIEDLRKEFNAPDMRAVVASVGFDGYGMNENYLRILAAQMNVGDPVKHPEFSKKTASVDTRDFWRDVEEAPQPQGHHYNRSAETYLLTGEAMGRAMVNLLGGAAETIPPSGRGQAHAKRVAEAAAAKAPTPEQAAASLAATRPMVLDGALVSFTTDPRRWQVIEAALNQLPPARPSSLLDDDLDIAAGYFRAVGIPDYDWRPINPDLRTTEWDFLPVNVEDPAKGIADLAVLAPQGQENWFAPEFDARANGWKRATGPFGGDRKLPSAPPVPEWYGGPPRSAATTAFDSDGVLLRNVIGTPSLKDGHRYRIRVAGSVRATVGDGYAIFVNGRPLAESKAGVVAWRRESGRPRGGHIHTDMRGEFKSEKVTLAVAGFPMNNQPADRFLPHGQPLQIWIEEMKLPPLVAPQSP